MTAVAENTSGRENARKRARGYISDYRPNAKTRALLEQVKAVLDEYEDYLPVTVRQVFYRLVGAYGYPKDERAYDRLKEHLVNARRGGVIPFDTLRDDGVTVIRDRWFAEPADFWDHVAGQAQDYRRDKQAGQPVYVELWCESSGMMPQLARVANRFSVPVFSCGAGFASLTAVRHIVDRAVKRNVDTVLLHVGDFDPSGTAVFSHLAEDTAAFMERDRVLHRQRIRTERVALTAEQVAAYDLPSAPAKATDSRSRTWNGGTCQAEALAPDVLASLVREAIVYQLDVVLLDEHEELEAEERVQLLRALPKGAS